MFARAERIETDELLPGHGGGFGLGALYSLNSVPTEPEPEYGGDPQGGMLFVRLQID